MYSQSAKKEVIDRVIVSMEHYLENEVLRILENVLVNVLTDANVELIQTMPVEVKDSIDQQNEYIIRLYLYKKKKLKKKTLYQYMLAVKRLITYIYKPLNKMDEMDIYRYLQWYEERNVAAGGRRNDPVTVNNERRYLSAFFTWMRKEKMIAENPVDGVEALKTVRKPIDYFRDEEMAKLRDGCVTLRDRALIEVLRSTGARIGEVLAIRKDMIDWVNGDIVICGEKGERFRPVYLDAEARYHYRKYMESRKDESPYLFVAYRKPNRPLSEATVRSDMKSIAKRVGVTSRVYPHKMRKTLGMNLKNQGVDIGTISEILGHASPNVTANYYAQSTPETLRSVRRRIA